jgi:DNA-binding CsgD family transcriptional regulator
MRYDLSILTERERSVLHIIATGVSHQQAAKTLFRSRHTVDTHLERIRRKLQVETQLQYWRLMVQVADEGTGRHAVVGDIG